MSPDFERLVGRAILDSDFRKQLFNDPDGAVASGGFNLSTDEIRQVRDAVRERSQRGDAVEEALARAASGSSWG